MGTSRPRAPLEWVTDVVLAASLAAWGLAEVYNGRIEVLFGPKWANAVTFTVMSLLLLIRRQRPALCLPLQCAVMGLLVVATGGRPAWVGYSRWLPGGLRSRPTHRAGGCSALPPQSSP